LNPKKLIKILNKEAAFKRDWKNKLSAQIHNLPDYEDVFRMAKRHLKKIT